MKSQILLFIFVLSGLFVHPASVYALDFQGRQTPFSAPINFCETDAKIAIAELDKLMIGKAEEIKKLKTEINDLNAKKNLVGEFLKIRDEFKSSFEGIKNQQQIHDLHLSLNLDNFKKLLKTSLTMSMVNLVAKEKKSSANAKNIQELCKSAENAKSNLCDYINNKFLITYSPEIQTLNKTLSNVYMALDHSTSPETIKTELEAIYNTIPTPVAPDKILSDLKKHSPNLVAILNASKDKETILNCLAPSNSNESCKQLMDDPAKRETIKAIVTSEMAGVHREFSEKKFNHFFSTVDTSTPIPNEKITEEHNQKVSAVAAFLRPELAKEALDKFSAACTQTASQSLGIKQCEEQSQKIETLLKAQGLENERKLKEAMSRLDQIMSSDGSLATIKKMKQYVSEKYLRNCNNAKESDIASNSICPYLNEEGKNIDTNLPGDSSQIGQLNLKLGNIIGVLQSQNTPSNQRGEVGPFSKQELAAYKNSCQNTALSKESIAAAVCRDIYSESNKIAHLRESADWDEFNRRYLIVPDQTSKSRFRAMERKSNARIFAEGFAQSIPNVIPIMLGKLQFDAQLDYMTNLGLYNKQIKYMNSYNSPWMLNNPYFQGNYFPLTTPFTGLGTTTTAPVTPLPANGGFKF